MFSRGMIVVSLFLAVVNNGCSSVKEEISSVVIIPATELNEHDRRQRDCLADILFFEGRDQPRIGRKAIAAVAFKRSEERGLSLCQVERQPSQFEYYSTLSKSMKKKIKRAEWRAYQKVKKEATSWYKAPSFYKSMAFNHFLNPKIVKKRYGRLPKWYYAGTNHTEIDDHVFFYLT